MRWDDFDMALVCFCSSHFGYYTKHATQQLVAPELVENRHHYLFTSSYSATGEKVESPAAVVAVVVTLAVAAPPVAAAEPVPRVVGVPQVLRPRPRLRQLPLLPPSPRSINNQIHMLTRHDILISFQIWSMFEV